MADARRQRETLQQVKSANAPEVKPPPSVTTPNARSLKSSHVPIILILLSAILLGWAVVGQQSGSGDTGAIPEKPDTIDGVATDWLEARMDSLDQKLEFASGQITELETRLLTTDKLEAQIARLNESVERLNRLTAGLEPGGVSTASLAAGPPGATPETDTPAARKAIPESAPPPQDAASAEESKRTVQELYEQDNKDSISTAGIATQAATQTASESAWNINLISSPKREDAVNFANRAKAKGVATDLRQVSVRGTPYWRVQISGFATHDEALAHSNSVKQSLGLKDTWIYSE